MNYPFKTATSVTKKTNGPDARRFYEVGPPRVFHPVGQAAAPLSITTSTPTTSNHHLVAFFWRERARRRRDGARASSSSAPGPRSMKQTIATRYRNVIAPFLEGGIMPERSYKSSIDQIHTGAVRRVIAELDPNPVLEAEPPKIDKSEVDLPRAQRTALAQLRSGDSSHLEEYRHRIGLAPNAICPECRLHRHSVRHLFRCPVHPTPLLPVDLWRRPVQTMEFLLSLPSFSSLLPPDPLLPPPPPDSPDSFTCLPPPPPASPPDLSFSSLLSSPSSLRFLYCPPPSPCSSSSSTSPKHKLVMNYDDNPDE